MQLHATRLSSPMSSFRIYVVLSINRETSYSLPTAIPCSVRWATGYLCLIWSSQLRFYARLRPHLAHAFFPSNNSFTFPFQNRKNIAALALSPNGTILITVDEGAVKTLSVFMMVTYALQ